jgi:hypothetical protein
VAELVVHADIGNVPEYGYGEYLALDKEQQVTERGNILCDCVIHIKDFSAQFLFHMAII